MVVQQVPVAALLHRGWSVDPDHCLYKSVQEWRIRRSDATYDRRQDHPAPDSLTVDSVPAQKWVNLNSSSWTSHDTVQQVTGCKHEAIAPIILKQASQDAVQQSSGGRSVPVQLLLLQAQQGWELPPPCC